jgi:DNA-binding HxlR family transcriptional regulator
MTAIYDDIRDAANLICQPLLLEVLVGTASGSKPRDAIPADADAPLLMAAVQRLAAIGAVQRLSYDAGPDEELFLTSRGEQLIELLRELAANASA